MNLSSLVHTSRDPQLQQHQHQQHQDRTQEPREVVHYPSSSIRSTNSKTMAPSLTVNTFDPLHKVRSHSQSYGYVATPQPPPSPPMDETSRCSLPSISSLLGLADSSSSPMERTTSQQADYRSHSSKSIPTQQYATVEAGASARGALPPTPPMHSDYPSLGGRQTSPTAAALAASAAASETPSNPRSNSHFGVITTQPPHDFAAPASAINNIEPYAQRQHIPPMQQLQRCQLEQQQTQRSNSMPAAPSHTQSPYSSSSSPNYVPSPGAQSLKSYYPSPVMGAGPASARAQQSQLSQPQASGLYYQRPLPQTYAPHLPSLLPPDAAYSGVAGSSSSSSSSSSMPPTHDYHLRPHAYPPPPPPPPPPPQEQQHQSYSTALSPHAQVQAQAPVPHHAHHYHHHQQQQQQQQQQHLLWQHHHHISPSAQAGFPASQDRYVCATCSKAFSRPSSLRIHSHSHTGEKPFRCPHGRCGKAFSVRSNMKRHERGCHGFEAQAQAQAQTQTQTR